MKDIQNLKVPQSLRLSVYELARARTNARKHNFKLSEYLHTLVKEGNDTWDQKKRWPSFKNILVKKTKR